MTFHDPTQHPATGDERLPGHGGDEAQAEAPPGLVEPLRDEAASPVPPYAWTRLSGFWAALAVCIAVLVILIVFFLFLLSVLLNAFQTIGIDRWQWTS